MSPFEVLKKEGINIDLTSLEKVLSDNGESMASTELSMYLHPVRVLILLQMDDKDQGTALSRHKENPMSVCSFFCYVCLFQKYTLLPIYDIFYYCRLLSAPLCNVATTLNRG